MYCSKVGTKCNMSKQQLTQWKSEIRTVYSQTLKIVIVIVKSESEEDLEVGGRLEMQWLETTKWGRICHSSACSQNLGGEDSPAGATLLLIFILHRTGHSNVHDINGKLSLDDSYATNFLQKWQKHTPIFPVSVL